MDGLFLKARNVDELQILLEMVKDVFKGIKIKNFGSNKWKGWPWYKTLH